MKIPLGPSAKKPWHYVKMYYMGFCKYSWSLAKISCKVFHKNPCGFSWISLLLWKFLKEFSWNHPVILRETLWRSHPPIINGLIMPVVPAFPYRQEFVQKVYRFLEILYGFHRVFHKFLTGVLQGNSTSANSFSDGLQNWSLECSRTSYTHVT